eukprot:gene1873-3631_t
MKPCITIVKTRIQRKFLNLTLRGCSSTPTSTDPVLSPKPNTEVKSSWIATKLGLYSELSKYRLSSLVVMTTGAGFLCAGSPVEWTTMVAACSGTALCAASANTFNQIMEKNNDARMNRTRGRPLPSGRISSPEAIAWAVTAGTAGTGVLYAATNPVVAALGAANIFLYAGPYTISKQMSEINTWIGAVVGAIPPVMGWAAATGGCIVAAEPAALASLLFLWQFPHFFALSWLHREDYTRGGFQMIAVNDIHGKRSAQLIWRYSLYLSTLPVITSVMGMTSYMFAVEGTAANLYLLYLAQKFNNKQSNGNAKKIFLCSLWYLPLLMFGFVFHNRLWNDQKDTDKISEVVLAAKDKLGAVCVHNIIALKNGGENKVLCPKVTTDQIAEGSISATATMSPDLTTDVSSPLGPNSWDPIAGAQYAY